MASSIVHNFTSAVADDLTQPEKIQPSHWNADHDITDPAALRAEIDVFSTEETNAAITDAIDGSSAVIGNNAVTNAKLRDSGATSVIGRSANSAGDPADISATVDGQYLQRVAGALVWAVLQGDLPTIAALSTTSFGRSFLTLANSAAGRTLLALVIGTDVQAFHANLAAFSGLTGASNKIARFTGVGAMDLLTFDTDTALTANSDTVIASQHALKSYIDSVVTGGAVDVMIFKGVIDCSANPNYPAADAGNLYKISVAGKIGGASGAVVEAGDTIYCITDSTASGTQAGVGANWVIAQVNIDGAVTGPSSATTNRIATFNGTSGKIIQDGGNLISDLILKSLFTTKGDLAVATAANTPARLGVGANGQVLVARSGATPGVAWEYQYGTILITIDGSGAVLATGVKGDIKVDFNGVIVEATLLADQSGSIVVNVWKDVYANYPPDVADKITASAPPTITSGTKSTDTTLTGWTTSFSAGDIFRFNVDSATTITRVTLALKVQKN